MIVVKLEGGHSNQLFQYAAGRRLADKLGVELFMDKHWFSTIVEGDTYRFYELGGYKLSQDFIDRKEFAIVENKPNNFKARLYDATKGRKKPRLKHALQEGSRFNKKVLNLPDNIYLEGWWQDQRYFKDIRPTLLKEIELKNKPNAKNSNWLKEVQKTNSVSLHIRRGDYVTNKSANIFHGVMGIPYYQKSIDYLIKKSGQKDLRLFIFSNDIAWCKANLKFKQPIVFIDGKNSGAEDMRLMKHCRHNVLANSSFSWWGAWLNQNPGKIVIAPKVWFQDETANTETSIVPTDWVRI